VDVGARGYAVHLVDPAELHLAQAREASARQADAPLAGVAPGDARGLPADDVSAAAVLLLGPLYHLRQAADRDRALREARRVLRPGGVALAAAISYFAPTIDGIRNAKLDEPGFEAIVEHDLRAGLHRKHLARRPGAARGAPSGDPRRVEAEPALLGASSHFLAVGRRRN
jgi:SAM-dependent methyltransferase